MLKYLDKALNSLAKYLDLPQADYRELFQKTSPKKEIFKPRDNPHLKTKKLSILFLIVRVFLQLGAIKSQSMKHREALKCANAGKFYYKMFIYNLQLMCREHSIKAKAIESDLNETSGGMHNPYFNPIAKIPEFKELKNFTNSPLVSDFNKFCEEVLNNDPTEKVDQFSAASQPQKGQPDFDGLGDDEQLSSIIFWKHNKENNQRYFKKELAKRSRDLGVSAKMTTIGLTEFNIGHVMHIKAVHCEKLNEDFDFFDYFNVKRVVDVILTYSCCLFTVSTENRFLCQRLLEDLEQGSNGGQFGVEDVMWTNQKDSAFRMRRLRKNKNFIRS